MPKLKLFMNDSRITTAIVLFILIQPFYDVSIFVLNRVLNINHVLISLIRPLIGLVIYFSLLAKKDITRKNKLLSMLPIALYGMYAVCHLININGYFFDQSYGRLNDELRHLAVYGYYFLMWINLYVIMSTGNAKDRENIEKSVVYAACTVSALHIVSIITGTSPLTYHLIGTKFGFKGWAVSSHYVGHSVLLSLPVLISVLIDKNSGRKTKCLLILLPVVSLFYLHGTKTSAFGLLGFLIVSLLIKGIYAILKKEKFTISYVFLLIIVAALAISLPYTSARGNLDNQIKISKRNTDLSTISFLNEDPLEIEPQKSLESQESSNINNSMSEEPLEIEPQKSLESQESSNTFKSRMQQATNRTRERRSHVKDNRQVQLMFNKELRSSSPLLDKVFGYGYYTMRKNTWVETDLLALFFSYGLLGVLLIVGLPLMFTLYWGIRALLKLRNMRSEAWRYATGVGLGTVVVTVVGYTMFFAQTVFYLAALQVFAVMEFRKVAQNGE